MKYSIIISIILLEFFILEKNYSQISISSDNSLPDNSAILDIKSINYGLSIPRMTESQRNIIENPANGLLIFQTDGKSGFYYYKGSTWNVVSKSAMHYPGELFGGGVVFWVDHTGQHGLICSMIDLNTAQIWSNKTSTLIGETAQSDWDGLNNSFAIIGQSGHTSSAAKLCLDYVNEDYGSGVYSDWYLPSRTEFIDLWKSLWIVQKALDTDGNPNSVGLSKEFYWASKEGYTSYAWSINLKTGESTGGASKSSLRRVRAVRAF